ncbi:MAG: hypothetical protein KAQ89_00600 [Planctomycetes bacterium]|nr:hypothetical protein [Planctomycetota bacterium]
MDKNELFLQDPEKKEILESYDRKLRVYIIGLFSLIVILMIPFLHKQGSQLILSSLLGIIGATFSITSCLVTFMLLHNSKRQQIISKAIHEIADHSANSEVHHFSKFREHIEWIRLNLGPENFSQKPVIIKLAISTPLYGVGAHEDISDGKSSLALYLDFLKAWVAEFDGTGKSHVKSVFALTFWGYKDHRETFGGLEIDNDIKELIPEFKKVFRRLYDLKKANKVDLVIHQGSRSDARIFYASNNDNASAMTVVFSPLTKSAIDENKWALSGFSASSKRGLELYDEFSHLLSFEDFSTLPKDITHLFTDPDRFINLYFPQFPSGLATTGTPLTVPVVNSQISQTSSPPHTQAISLETSSSRGNEQNE